MKKLFSLATFVYCAAFGYCQSNNKIDSDTIISLPQFEEVDTIIIDCPYTNHVWEDPKIPAQFPGGIDSMKAYIKQNLILSIKESRKYKGQAIYAKLTINKIGNVLEVEFLKAPLNEDLTQRFEKVCQSMPKWHPAQENSKRHPPPDPDDPIGDEEPPLRSFVYVDGCINIDRSVNSKKIIVFRLNKL